MIDLNLLAYCSTVDPCNLAPINVIADSMLIFMCLQYSVLTTRLPVFINVRTEDFLIWYVNLSYIYLSLLE